MIRKTMAGMLCVLAAASIATAGNTSVGVDIATPNARVSVGTSPAPPPPQVVVVEKQKVVVVDKDHKDNGKHKGHKKHKKDKKHKDEHDHH